MADVPDQAVFRGVEHVMERDSEFDDAKARPEMPASDRDRVDGFPAQLVGKLTQLGGLELAQVRGRADSIEEGSVRGLRHDELHRQTKTNEAANLTGCL